MTESKKPTQPFTIDPEVEATMRRGQQQRAISQRVRAYLADVTEHLLREYPEQAAAIAIAMEGEAAWIRSLPKQNLNKEQHGDDRRDAPAVSESVQGVPGVEG